jgi:hypothetical protein
MDSVLYAKIKAAGRYCRDVETRRKINLFLEAVRSNNVEKTMTEQSAAVNNVATIKRT